MNTAEKTGPLLSTVRWVIFGIWLAIFIGYVLAFLIQGSQPGIKASEANEAAWVASYILMPVIIAFGTFQLGPKAEANLTADAGKRMRAGQFAMLIILTIAFHGLVIVYFWLNVWRKEFNFPETSNDSYTSAVNYGFKLLLFLGAGSMLGVNFVLGRTDVALGSQPHADSIQ